MAKVKSDRAWGKWFQSTAMRYYTIDFNSRTFYYSRAEGAAKSVSAPLHFRQILGAELLPPIGNKSRKSHSHSHARGFLLKTPDKNVELRAPSTQHAEQWVQALQNAASAGASNSPSGSGLLQRHPSLRWDPCSGTASAAIVSDPPIVSDDASGAARDRERVLALPTSLRSAVADEIGHDVWARLYWRERLATVEAHASRMPQALSTAAGSGGAAGPLSSLTRLERLKLIFDSADGLQVLVAHHLDDLVLNVVGSMQTRSVAGGEVLLEQGQTGDRVYIVDEGQFDVLVQRGDGPPGRVMQHGPGAVFGELALVSSAPSKKTVRASTAGRVWTLDRGTFQTMLKAPEDTKTIGLLGGVMMLINNLAGPTIVSMPGLAQEAGWLSILLVQVVVAAFACACGYMLLGAMRRMPGNDSFDQTIEFTNLAIFYLPHWLYVAVMFCYHTNSILSLMSLIIQSGQVIDYLSLNMYGCSPGLDLSGLGYVCGTRTDSVTPFGDSIVISSSMVVVGIICAPFAMMNLDDNVILQYVAIAGLSVMAVIWVWLLVAEPTFPAEIPTFTTSQSGLIGTVLFNFAFCSTLPSWANEKRKDVSVGATFGITLVYVVLIYTVVGVVGGMAYPPFYTTDENLFSKLNAGGSSIGKATVTLYPMLQNFTSIPVFSILIRYNLLQSGIDPTLAVLIAVGMPWIMSVPFYTGSGFDTISEVGGLFTSSVINFIVPVVLYVLARRRFDKAD